METNAQDLARAAEIFVEARPRLLEIARRIVQDGVEAEDVVQEAWLRWQATDRASVINPIAFLATTTGRLALNVVQSARSRYETYADPALLMQEDPRVDSQARVEQADALEGAVQLLLETLNPSERASFVLREAFDYPYEQIARVVQLTPVNVRQVVRRSRKRLADPRRTSVMPGVHRRLVHAFRVAADAGNVAFLERVLAAELAS